MSFSERRRDGGDGGGVDGKYILCAVIGAEFLRPDALSVANQCRKHSLHLISSSTSKRL